MAIRSMLCLLCIAAFATPAPAQSRQDRAVFEVRRDATLDSLKRITRPEPKPDDKRVMQLDFAAIPAPRSTAEFTTVWHSPPVKQGISGMCWCFAATSFLESEIHRTSGRTIKLSELHTVYWEYVEKARGYVQTRGDTHLGEGSESNAVFRILKTYGAVPAAAYTGLKDGRTIHDHERTLFAEFKQYLEGVKAGAAWNEDAVVATVRSLLDNHLGPPPATVSVDGKTYTPQEYLAKVIRLNPDDYVDFLSFMEHPSYTSIEYDVPDNWWHSRDYINIPLADFMAVIRNSIRKGYSVIIGGDFSEPGYSRGAAGIAVVPSFDIPSSAITEEARQFRFSNGTTTDDHGIHLVGYVEQDGKDWYLIKDSWSSAYNSTHPGYYFYHEDYVKLKMLGCAVHRDAVKEILTRCTGVRSAAP